MMLLKTARKERGERKERKSFLSLFIMSSFYKIGIERECQLTAGEVAASYANEWEVSLAFLTQVSNNRKKKD